MEILLSREEEGYWPAVVGEKMGVGKEEEEVLLGCLKGVPDTALRKSAVS